MFAFVLLVTALAAAVGVAGGWVARSITSWCPHCGDGLTCAGCNQRPGFSAALHPTNGNAVSFTPLPGREGPKA